MHVGIKVSTCLGFESRLWVYCLGFRGRVEGLGLCLPAAYLPDCQELFFTSPPLLAARSTCGVSTFGQQRDLCGLYSFCNWQRPNPACS